MAEKICVFCVWFVLHFGTPAYSEYTPGDPAAAGCAHHRWFFTENEEWDLSDYRAGLLQAQTCEQFEPCTEWLQLQEAAARRVRDTE